MPSITSRISQNDHTVLTYLFPNCSRSVPTVRSKERRSEALSCGGLDGNDDLKEHHLLFSFPFFQSWKPFSMHCSSALLSALECFATIGYWLDPHHKIWFVTYGLKRNLKPWILVSPFYRTLSVRNRRIAKQSSEVNEFGNSFNWGAG